MGEELINEIVREVAELPDRTSPEDWPEAMLVTGDELADILRDRLAALRPPLGAAQEAVGEAGTMPGTAGFTMACFHAEKVPVGTKLYAAAHSGEARAVAFLENGTRYKIACHELAGVGVYGLPLALNGRWVALVAADNDCHIAASPAPREPAAVPDVDWLANVIRSVDGNHSMGAGQLAEAIVSAIAAAPSAPAVPACACADLGADMTRRAGCCNAAPAVPVGDGWVKPSERAPEKPGSYLVMLQEDNVMGWQWDEPIIAEWDFWTAHPGEWTVFCPDLYSNKVISGDVLWWQPLPAAPAATNEQENGHEA